METFAGNHSLANNLFPLIERLEKAIGGEDIGRLTIIDAEMVSLQNFRDFESKPGHYFITVLKGPRKNYDLIWTSEWAPGPRGRGWIREAMLTIKDEGQPEIMLRCIHLSQLKSEKRGTRYLTNDRKTSEREVWLTPVQIVEAHRYLESNQQIGKIVVTV